LAQKETSSLKVGKNLKRSFKNGRNFSEFARYYLWMCINRFINRI